MQSPFTSKLPAPAGNTLNRLAAIAFSACLLAATPCFAQPDAARVADQWDALLEKHVRSGSRDGVALHLVNYAALAQDQSWPELLEALSQATEPTSDREKMAFWLNAYNILAIKAVLDAYPVESINDAGPDKTENGGLNVWKAPAGNAAGESRSLDDIEHKILRPLGDARIHAAIVCASVSCPDIRREAYRAEKLDTQLTEQLTKFLANSDRGSRFDVDSGTLHLSTIFQWFGKDFTKDGQTLLGYLTPYLPPKTAAAVASNSADSIRVEHIPYDWRLNDTAKADRSGD